MSIKIVKAQTQKVDNIKAVLYGFPNSGKTTLALSAEKPLLIDFDKGSYRAGNKADKDIVQIGSWSDIGQKKKSIWIEPMAW